MQRSLGIVAALGLIVIPLLAASQSPVKTYPTHTVLTQFRSSLQTRLLNHRGRAPFGNDVSSR